MLSPGSRVVFGQVGWKSSAVFPGVPLSSVTETLVKVTLPVLVTTYVQVIGEPTGMTTPSLPLVVLLMLMDGFWSAGVVTASQASSAPPSPSSTQAALKKLPASISAWVMM